MSCYARVLGMYDSDTHVSRQVEDGATGGVLVFYVLTNRRNCAALPIGSIAGVSKGEAIRNNRVV